MDVCHDTSNEYSRNPRSKECPLQAIRMADGVGMTYL
ncbi:hypothetical protein Rrhod_3178 [Rhodococcus rhodnii LMG 5362]|uniref:Uncharacterized protein n=1 Tax=Rhodococcus rhodnii LMG 5362 TaxID=1273125 RepID=R7WJE2_9NOCA|nr:hypothetical protein Rrhod_3178 [Rhodococcus rhodnii LMG 5362]